MAIFNSYVSLPEGTQNGYRIPTLTKNHWSSESSSWGFHLDSGWGQDLQSFKHMCLFFFSDFKMYEYNIYTYIYIYHIPYITFFLIHTMPINRSLIFDLGWSSEIHLGKLWGRVSYLFGPLIDQILSWLTYWCRGEPKSTTAGNRNQQPIGTLGTWSR